MLGNLNGPERSIGLQPPAEAAADQMVMDGHLVQWQSSSLRCCGLHARKRLASDPDFAVVFTEMDGAVHRFHGRVGEKRHLIDRLDLGGCTHHRLLDVADCLRNGSCAERCFFELDGNFLGRELRVRSIVPFNL
jgi:hypothetical protein